MVNGKQKIKKDDWRTPDWLFRSLNNRFRFTVDSAATSKNNKLQYFFNDGLSNSWKHHMVFCNPPFSDKSKWIEKAHYEVLNNECYGCIMILPNCIDTKCFNKYVHRTFSWEHLPHRVSFLDNDNKPVAGNPSGTIIVYFWEQLKIK